MTFGVTLNFDRKLLHKEKAFFKIAILLSQSAQNQLTLIIREIALSNSIRGKLFSYSFTEI